MNHAVQGADWHDGFLSVLPAVQTHARIQFRNLRADRREEAVQEAIAAACMNYQLLAARGQLHVLRPSTLADFAVRHVRTGRHVGGRQDGAKDVLSPRAQKRHHLTVNRLHDAQRRCGTIDWLALAIAEKKAPIPDTAAFRIDFARFLRMQTRRDRRIMKAMIAGEPGKAIARRFGLSPGRVSQLRRRFERDWGRFHGQLATQAA